MSGSSNTTIIFTLWSIPMRNWTTMPSCNAIDECTLNEIKIKAANSKGIDETRLLPYRTPVSDEALRQIID